MQSLTGLITVLTNARERSLVYRQLGLLDDLHLPPAQTYPFTWASRNGVDFDQGFWVYAILKVEIICQSAADHQCGANIPRLKWFWYCSTVELSDILRVHGQPINWTVNIAAWGPDESNSSNGKEGRQNSSVLQRRHIADGKSYQMRH